MNKGIEVLRPGLLTTVQDLGRYGYQQYGMVVAGAMDAFSLAVGNLLVGNPRNAAGLEITLIGPELQFHQESVIAITGADLKATLDNHPLPRWKSIYVEPGQILRFHRPQQGIRAYLCIAGGIDVKPIMKSRSTFLKGKMGGYQGRVLQSGDILPVGSTHLPFSQITGRFLSPREQPVYDKKVTLRVIMGPQADAFTEEGVHTFLTSSYKVTPQSDRMGTRLEGPPIQHKEGADIISDGIAPGSIQVPAGGQPIILLADRNTTGGYTKIATVISVDLPLIAQSAPGHTLSFRAVEIEEAQKLAIAQEKLLRQLEIIGRKG